MKLSSIRHAHKYGLVVSRILQRLDALGLAIEPYYVLQEGDFGCNHSQWGPKLSEYDAGFLGSEDMDEVASYEEDVSSEKLLQRLNDGHRCFALKHHDQIAAYMWCDFNEFNHPPARFSLKENEAYLYNANTQSNYRGKGLAPYMRYQCYKALNETSKDTFYSYSDCFNTPAVRFKKKLNARFLKLCLHIRLGKKYTWNLVLKQYKSKPLVN